MDTLELYRRFGELEDRIQDLEDRIRSMQLQINNLERNKTDKITYPYINPGVVYTQPYYYPYTITCQKL